jgi:hypothetical protein
MSDNNNNNDLQPDDAKETNKKRRERRAVIFDEDNLRQNKEWHDANPVTKHITEPDTPYNYDDGKYSDSDDEELLKEARDEHVEHQTKQNTEANKNLSHSHHHHHHHHNKKSTISSSSSGESGHDNDDDAAANKNNNDEDSSSSPVGEGESSGWINAQYNKLGSEVLLTQPIAFTKEAPVLREVPEAEGAKQNNNNNQNDDDDANQQQQLKKRPVGLKLHAVTEEDQAAAAQLRHDAEFKTMRKAVYRDEGMKFREMMKKAQQEKDEEDEDVEED